MTSQTFPFAFHDDGPHKVALLTCAFCPGEARIHLGDSHIDLARLAANCGFRMTPDGRPACSADCANKAKRHPLGAAGEIDSDFTIDADVVEQRLLASRGQGAASATKYMSTGSASTDRVELHERALRVTCRAPGCPALQVIDQQRAGDGEWQPTEAAFLSMLGWVGKYCGKSCAHRCGIDARIEAALPKSVAVLSIPDASYQKSRARALAAAVAPADARTRFENELAARSAAFDEKPKPAAAKAR